MREGGEGGDGKRKKEGERRRGEERKDGVEIETAEAIARRTASSKHDSLP